MKFHPTRTGSIPAAAAALIAFGGAVLAAPSCGQNNGNPATGAPIEIGALMGKTGPGDFSASGRAAKAYFDCVNANGGVNGRPIHFTLVDDGWKPEQAAQLATKLLKDQKVVGMVGTSSFVDCAVNSKLYDLENVAVIGGEGISRECYFSKNIAPLSEGPRLSVLGGATFMREKFDVRHVACIAGNVAGIGQWGCGGMEAWGKTHGLKVDTVLIDLHSVDATSVLLQAASLEPDAIVTLLPMEAAVAIFNAAEQQDLGDKYKWFGPTSLYDPAFPKAIGPYWSGKIYVEQELEPIDKQGPDTLNWLAVLNQYGAPSDRRDTFSQAGYLAAKVATGALLKLDPEKIDRAAVSDAFRSIKNFHSDMLCGGWYYGPGSVHAANHAGSIARVVDGGFKSEASCIELEDPDIADAVKQEKQLGLAR